MNEVADRPEVAEVRPGEELDWAALERHLRQQLPHLEGDFSVRQFPNGSANLTYLVRFGEDALVVRRPPFGVIAAGAHDMLREYTVLSRLHAAYPRAPLGVHYCADTAVIGAHFLVSEYRPGVVVWDRVPDSLAVGPEPGRRIGFAVVDALADLHLVDPARCDLGYLGRPDGYLDRQVRGWQRRWEAVATEGRGTVDRVAELLARHLPESGQPALVHNDFKVDNCQFAPGDPDQRDLGLRLGHGDARRPAHRPGDAAQLLAGRRHPRRGRPRRRRTSGCRAATRSSSATPRGPGSGSPARTSSWYEAFGCWKTAIIMQQLYVRHLRGETSDERMNARGRQVVRIADRALALAERLSLDDDRPDP